MFFELSWKNFLLAKKTFELVPKRSWDYMLAEPIPFQQFFIFLFFLTFFL